MFDESPLKIESPAPLAVFEQDVIHPDNLKLEQERLAEIQPITGTGAVWRMERRAAKLQKVLNGRLSLRQRLGWLYGRLTHPSGYKLARLGYNDLIAQRSDLRQQLRAIVETFTEIRARRAHADGDLRDMLVAEMDGLKATGHSLQQQIKRVTERLQYLEPFLAEYRSVVSRLDLHYQSVETLRLERAERAQLRKEAIIIERILLDVFANTKECHRLWVDKSGKERIATPYFQEIGIDSTSIWFLLSGSSQTLFGWRSQLPYRVNVDDLISESTLHNMSVACRRQVEARYDVTNTHIWFRVNRLDSPDGLPKRVTYRQMFTFYPINRHDEFPFPGGVRAGNKNMWLYLAETPHVLVAGYTRSGKSNFVNCLIATQVTMHSPDELRIVLIDNKGGIEFTHWTEAPHRLGDVVEQVENVLPMLENVIRLMMQRQGVLKASGTKKIETFNSKVAPEDRMPRVMVFVDELATLLNRGKLTTDIHQAMTVIASQGAASGIHLILCTQHPSKEVVPMPVKTNINCRVTGRMPSGSASMIVLDTHQAKELAPVPGRMIIQTGPDPEEVQTAFISDGDIADAVEKASYYAPGPDLFAAIGDGPVSVKLGFDVDDLVELALNEYDGQMPIGNMFKNMQDDPNHPSKGALEKMVKGLIAEGSVESKGQRYLVEKAKGKGNRPYCLIPAPEEEDTAEVEPIEDDVVTA